MEDPNIRKAWNDALEAASTMVRNHGGSKVLCNRILDMQRGVKDEDWIVEYEDGVGTWHFVCAANSEEAAEVKLSAFRESIAGAATLRKRRVY